MKRTVFVSALLLLAGLAAGWFARGAFIPQATKTEIDQTHKSQKPKHKSSSNSAAAENMRLKSELVALKENMEQRVAKAVERAAETLEQERPSPERRFEEMKKNDPERYAEHQRRRAQFRQEMKKRMQERNDFLGSLDMTTLSEAAQENHKQLLAQIEHVDSLMNQMREARENNQDVSKETHEEMRQAMDELRELYDRERDNLLAEVAKDAGYDGDAAEDFVAVVKQIWNNTQVAPPMMRGRHGPPGR